MRIVIDTNVVMSAIFFGGKPSILLSLLEEGKFEAYVSFEIVSEYYEIFNRMVNKTHKKLSLRTLEIVLASMKFITNNHSLSVSCDKDDDKFIECALSSGATYIVSGDNDLLAIKNHNGIQILKVSDFLSKVI